MDFAPIAFFVYNRPEHTKTSLKFLKDNQIATKSKIYFFSDGPKNENINEDVRKVRRFLHEVDGFGAKEIIYQEQNLGLANSVENAMRFLFEEKNYEEVIFIEDDVCVSEYFLEFCNAALKKYSDEQRIKMIAPGCYGLPFLPKEKSFLLPLGASMAWATWRRVYNEYEANPIDYKRLKKKWWKRFEFNLFGATRFYEILISTLETKTQSSWAIKFYWLIFKSKGLTLFPSQYLNNNIGFDGTGTHSLKRESSKIEKFDFKKNRILRFPSEINPDWFVFVYLIFFLYVKKACDSFSYRVRKVLNK